jgi:3D (Asp-Asp-Asp) domain-containing protein
VRLSGSKLLKVGITLLAVGGFLLLYEITIRDSLFFTRQLIGTATADPTAPPAPGVPLTFSATAYCKGLVTRAGVPVQAGSVAADSRILPLGSIVQLAFEDTRYDGIYTVLDTGPEITGREIDVYIWSCYEALDFGRRPVRLTMLRMGWHPQATTQGFFERLFRKPKVDPPPLPPRPSPVDSGDASPEVNPENDAEPAPSPDEKPASEATPAPAEPGVKDEP